MLSLAGRLVAAHTMDDDQLRRELVEIHQLFTAVEEICTPMQRELLGGLLAALDTEYLRRFPTAETSWPWPRPQMSSGSV